MSCRSALAALFLAAILLLDVSFAQAQGAAVNSVQFSPDGGRLAGGGSAGTIHIYDRASRAEMQVLDAGVFVNSLTFALGGAQVAGAYGDGTLRLWDAATGRLLHSPQADPSIAFFVAASPDGRTLATVGQDTRLRLWDAASGQLLRVIG